MRRQIAIQSQYTQVFHPTKLSVHTAQGNPRRPPSEAPRTVAYSRTQTEPVESDMRKMLVISCSLTHSRKVEKNLLLLLFRVTLWLRVLLEPVPQTPQAPRESA